MPFSTFRGLGVGVLMLAGCGDCLGRAERWPATPQDVWPASSVATVYVPDLSGLAQGLDLYLRRATTQSGQSLLEGVRSSVSQRFGFDPLDPQALSQGGIDPSAGAVIWSVDGSRRVIAAMKIKDRDRFDLALSEFVRRVDGAESLQRHELPYGVIQTLGRPFGDQVVPVLHWAHRGRVVLIAPPDNLDGLQRKLASLVERPPEGSSAPNPSASSEAQLVMVLRSSPTQNPAEKPAAGHPASENPTSDGGVSTATTHAYLGPTGLRIDTRATGLSPFETSGSQEEFSALVERGRMLLRHFPPAPTAVVVTTAAQTQTFRWLDRLAWLHPWMDRGRTLARRRAGLDLEREVLPYLSGLAVSAAYLTPADTWSKSVRRLQRSRTSLGAASGLVHAVFVAEVTDPKSMRVALENAQNALAQRGTKIIKTQRSVGPHTALIFKPDRPEPSFGWALMNKWYVYGVGLKEFDQVLESLAYSSKDLPPAESSGSIDPASEVVWAKASSWGTSAAVLSGSRVADRLRTLGSGGLGLGAIVAGLADTLRTLGDIRFFLQPGSEGFHFQMEQTFDQNP